MLIVNNMPTVHNHLKVIADCFKGAKKADLAVAYVQQSGVTLLEKPLAKIGRDTRLVCSLDMDITDPSAIKKLMEMGVKVKIYRGERGTLHTKLWLFQNANEQWECIVGSANLSAGGLRNNAEASVRISADENRNALQNALSAFLFLWEGGSCYELTDSDIDKFINVRNERKKMNSRIRKIHEKSERDSISAQVKILREFVQRWIDIGVHAPTGGSNVIGRIWRGWYIVPDQGYIDDPLMDRLHRICKIIHRAGGTIDISPSAKSPLDEILKITSGKLLRQKHKMTPRALFVRQEKNYLTHFEFAHHPTKSGGKPDKNILALTEYGEQFAQAKNVQDQKKIYTAAMQQYVYNGLHLLEFTYRLLNEVGKMDLTEFSFFANHAYSIGEVSNVAALIKMYRSLPHKNQNSFKKEMDEYFKLKLEHTAKNVRGNYDKSAKHTLSALGWCEGLRFDLDKVELSLLGQS